MKALLIVDVQNDFISGSLALKHSPAQEDGEEVVTYTFDVRYSGKIFASEDAYTEGASPIGGFNGKFDLDDGAAKTQYNLIKQAYLDLKTMEGFTDGTDC